MTKTTVIHHSADYDGIFCREIARKFLPDAELIGWDYKDPKIPFPDGQVYVLDLSPECFDVDASYAFDQCIWIDHHATAIVKFNPLIRGYRIDGVAACRLAWQWFKYQGECEDKSRYALPLKSDFVNRSVSEPLAVRLAGEYDIWDKRDPDAELFQHGLRSQDLGENMWELLLAEPQEKTWEGKHGVGEIAVEALLEAGRALQYAKTQEDASIIREMGFTFVWEGLTLIACNAARYNSHLFTAGLKPEHDACFGFKWSGGTWNVSLYHAPGKEHHDLSKIAVKYGGGGHRGACGFRTNTLPFIV